MPTLNKGISESSVVRPVGADPGPVGGCHVFVGFLGLKGFLSRFTPHEVRILVVRVLVHNYSVCP